VATVTKLAVAEKHISHAPPSTNAVRWAYWHADDALGGFFHLQRSQAFRSGRFGSRHAFSCHHDGELLAVVVGRFLPKICVRGPDLLRGLASHDLMQQVRILLESSCDEILPLECDGRESFTHLMRQKGGPTIDPAQSA
jgi:lysophospholipid acyltransferase (LPLAT)-like uncharacterized protein